MADAGNDATHVLRRVVWAADEGGLTVVIVIIMMMKAHRLRV